MQEVQSQVTAWSHCLFGNVKTLDYLKVEGNIG
jgi:hypothetical protein